MSNITINETVDVVLNGTLNQTKQATQQLMSSGDFNGFLSSGKVFLQSIVILLKTITGWISAMIGYPVFDYTKFGITIPIDLALIGLSAGIGFRIMKWRYNGGISFVSWLIWSTAFYAIIMWI